MLRQHIVRQTTRQMPSDRLGHRDSERRNVKGRFIFGPRIPYRHAAQRVLGRRDAKNAAANSPLGGERAKSLHHPATGLIMTRVLSAMDLQQHLRRLQHPVHV